LKEGGAKSLRLLRLGIAAFAIASSVWLPIFGNVSPNSVMLNLFQHPFLPAQNSVGRWMDPEI